MVAVPAQRLATAVEELLKAAEEELSDPAEYGRGVEDARSSLRRACDDVREVERRGVERLTRPTVVRPEQVWSILSAYAGGMRQESRVVRIQGDLAICVRLGHGRGAGKEHEVRIVTLLRGHRGARLEKEAPDFEKEREAEAALPDPPRPPRRKAEERTASELVKTRPPRRIGATPRMMEAHALAKQGLSTKAIAERMHITQNVANEYLRQARESVRDEQTLAAARKPGSR